MAQTNVNIRMDDELKRQLDLFCSEIGITASAAFNIFAKTVVRQQRIPFELSLNVPNETTVKAIEEGRELARDKNATRYTNMADLRAALEDEV
ncbi:MAG: type II toxin-antitoxin system RelB/DinJ family antitoxin [Ruminococcaceae bacterium]|nr:type II toxin-antitoxin system RelB/DinJ family antitoxin [Oscillospiraceae bacterium]